jgi:trans-aconitate methyltransferase
MDKNDVLEIYDEDYAQKYNQRFLLNEKSRKNADFEQETIRKLLGEIGEDAKWLDVAGGTGYFLSRFPNLERAGLDISPAMLKVAKQANPDALFVQGDYRDKRPQWEGKWELVSCMWWAYSYVESLSELEKVIENFASWTSKRGICFLPVCDRSCRIGNW